MPTGTRGGGVRLVEGEARGLSDMSEVLDDLGNFVIRDFGGEADVEDRADMAWSWREGKKLTNDFLISMDLPISAGTDLDTRDLLYVCAWIIVAILKGEGCEERWRRRMGRKLTVVLDESSNTGWERWAWFAEIL
jgi:hypothetical protein